MDHRAWKTRLLAGLALITFGTLAIVQVFHTSPSPGRTPLLACIATLLAVAGFRFSVYLGHLSSEKRLAAKLSEMHGRTVEALALTLGARDQITIEHLHRVRIYAEAIGEELNLSPDELDGLRAASLLHDIGKLAVPEHIICKPGKLTPEEFEKIKVHPIVGAEILESVQFPYPVVPIVAAHHEKWDGTGYPLGLAGDDIPIGARILSAVDCLDALASDRQYRRALPLDQAMKIVQEQSGKAFDPRVIEVLKRRYVQLERIARASASSRKRLPTDMRITCGAPAAGFAEPGALV